ncbi:MAG: multicopper oxidase family protein [Alphaproteobacteria bacterium]|nr:multicopper oxidase family protein [Alphaproteobacteria bacterium]
MKHLLPVTGLTRRSFLGSAAGGLLFQALPVTMRGASATLPPIDLVAAPAKVQLAPEGYPATRLWTFNGRAPGPVIRARQGDRLQAVATNHLGEATTIHFHGVRMPNAMDGVPHLTQPPIEPGESFLYDFELTDAGTFWYHPHANSAEQVGRGLHGALIVEEKTPPVVDRDLVWVLDDWRMTENAQLAAFGHPHDLSHAGRIGNTVTLNGRIAPPLRLRKAERVRLRLINAANARVFGLEFEGHRPWLIAIDGHPVSPQQIDGGQLAIAPGGRADLILDGTGDAAERHSVVDRYYPRGAYKLTDIIYEDGPGPRAEPLDPPEKLPDNPLPRPDVDGADTLQFALSGGAMGGMAGARLRGRHRDMRALAQAGMFWAINGVVQPGLDDSYGGEPLAVLQRGRSYRFVLRNESAFDHPIHLHGHSFLVLARNGVAQPEPAWHDTVLVRPRESAEIAFVADNPGDWMFHCHVLEHQHSGMMGFVRVTA